MSTRSARPAWGSRCASTPIRGALAVEKQRGAGGTCRPPHSTAPITLYSVNSANGMRLTPASVGTSVRTMGTKRARITQNYEC